MGTPPRRMLYRTPCLPAQAAAAEGCVLLKNAGGVLPLAPGARLAVVGPNAGCGASGTGNGTQPPCAAQVSRAAARDRERCTGTSHATPSSAPQLNYLGNYVGTGPPPLTLIGAASAELRGTSFSLRLYASSSPPRPLQRRSHRRSLRRQRLHRSPTRRARR